MIMSCVYDPMRSGMARQGYMEVMGKRMMVRFASKQRARQVGYNTTWDKAKARDSMNNLFNKEKIAGMVLIQTTKNGHYSEGVVAANNVGRKAKTGVL